MVRNPARPLFPKEKRGCGVCSTKAAVRRCYHVAGPGEPWMRGAGDGATCPMHGGYT